MLCMHVPDDRETIGLGLRFLVQVLAISATGFALARTTLEASVADDIASSRLDVKTAQNQLFMLAGCKLLIDHFLAAYKIWFLSL
jgi:hypothetical protein